MRGRLRKKLLQKQVLASLRGCDKELRKLGATLDEGIRQRRDFTAWLKAFNAKLEERQSPFQSKSPLLN